MRQTRREAIARRDGFLAGLAVGMSVMLGICWTVQTLAIWG